MSEMLVEASPLYVALAGIQQRFANVLGLTRFALAVDVNYKQGLRSAFGGTDYPYGIFKATNITLDREIANTKTIARHGSGLAMGEETSASVIVNHYFPAKLAINVTLNVLHYSDALIMIPQVIVASAAGLFDFVISSGTAKWTVTVVLDGDSIALPSEVDIDEGSTPGSMAIDFSMTVSTKIGFAREGAKINNEGIVTQRIDMLNTSNQMEVPE
jgi:hypothetical protein